MNESSLQTDHMVGHILPGIAYIYLGLTFLYYIMFPQYPILPCYWRKEIHVIKLAGWLLIIIGVVCFILWMIDVGEGNNSTKIHRVLSIMVFPLGVTMIANPKTYYPYRRNKLKSISKEEIDYRKSKIDETLGQSLLRIEIDPETTLWEDFLPIYCFINAAGYYGHRHTSTMDIMPTGEEEGHNGLFVLFAFAGIFFGISRFLSILRAQTVLFVFGATSIFMVGIWYCVLAGVLYGGAFGINGATYYDATADFMIMMFAVSTFFILAYLYLWKPPPKIDPGEKKEEA